MSAGVADLYLLDELLTDDERAVRDRVRAFCDEQVRPVINDYWERGEFPAVLLPGLAALHIAGGTMAEHGGPGMSARAAGLVAMELARCDGSISTFHGVHSGLAMRTIAMLGSAEQRARWLPAMVRLEQIGAFALTEPDHGSDAVNLETAARRDGEEYVLRGRKRWIGNGTFADLVVVWARDEEGQVGAFVVDDAHRVGFGATEITGKIAKRASVQADITLDDVRVPAAHRLAGGRSFTDAAAVLAAARPGVAWGALGHAVAAYEVAFGYLSQRVSFGRPLTGHQLVQARLAEMLSEITAMQLYCLRLADLAEDGTP